MTEFNNKYGVAFDDEIADEVEKFLSEGDSRSARIRKLVEIGLECERAMLDSDWYPPSHDERLSVVQDAMYKHMDEI